MFVPKNPRPYDFCGCPPCPICFDLVDDTKAEREMVVEIRAGEPIVESVPTPPEEIPAKDRVDGVLAAARELLGREPTFEELKQVAAGAQVVHEQRKAKTQEPPTLNEAAELRIVQKGVESIIRAKVKERAAPKTKPLNTNVIDNMDQKEVKKRTKTKAAEVAENPEYDVEVLREKYGVALRKGRYAEANRIRAEARRLKVPSF